MPLCFIAFGVVLILMLFQVVNEKQMSKSSIGLLGLFVISEICSFFAKNLEFFGVSVCYFIPIIFFLLFVLFNIKTINILLTFSIGIFLASGLIAIGYIDLSLSQVVEKYFFQIAFVCAFVPMIFLRKLPEQLISIILCYAIFITVLVLKKVNGLDLSNIVFLNLFSISFAVNIVLNVLIKNFGFGRKENVKKIAV